MFEPKIIACFPPADPYTEHGGLSLAQNSCCLPPQRWASVSVALRSALNILCEITESAKMRNWEKMCKYNWSNSNVKDIKKGKEVFPSQPFCLNTPRFLVGIVVFNLSHLQTPAWGCWCQAAAVLWYKILAAGTRLQVSTSLRVVFYSGGRGAS